MRLRSITASLMILALGSAREGFAQATVTFEVPLNLTQIPAGIGKVAVLCAITSEAIVIPPAFGAWSNLSQSPLSNFNAAVLGPNASRQEFWGASGSVVVTARVVVFIPADWLNNPVGKAASYMCAIQALNAATLKWDFLGEQAVAPFNLKLTPAILQGDFVW